MRLAIDAGILVAELLRARGRALLAHLALTVSIASPVWGEAHHELGRRTAIMQRRGRLAPQAAVALLHDVEQVIAWSIEEVPADACASFEPHALARIPRDPQDWPKVALALSIDSAVWTLDCDSLGCGLPTWTTGTLIAHLDGIDTADPR